jgi:hypothetical protein
MRAEFLADHDRRHATLVELQAALDGWVAHYNTERPHQALGMRPPIDRFALAAPAVDVVTEPTLAGFTPNPVHLVAESSPDHPRGVPSTARGLRRGRSSATLERELEEGLLGRPELEA